jgi:hypothetical protein
VSGTTRQPAAVSRAPQLIPLEALGAVERRPLTFDRDLRVGPCEIEPVAVALGESPVLTGGAREPRQLDGSTRSQRPLHRRCEIWRSVAPSDFAGARLKTPYCRLASSAIARSSDSLLDPAPMSFVIPQ